jgi:hypothetical protein
VILALLVAAGCGGGGSDVAVNEVRASGSEYVELSSRAARSISLDGYRLADGDPDGEPRLAGATVFTAEAVLPPGGFLLVLANLGTAAAPGPQSSCLTGGPDLCYHASWGVDADGEAVFLVDPGGHVDVMEVYPARPVGDDEAWGRVPDGDGDFVATRPTPGRPNEPSM